jgi:hypothetical protein
MITLFASNPDWQQQNQADSGQTMQLTDEQQQKIRQWAKEGCGLSEIQKRLRAECNLALTFMDVRLLILDLGLELKDQAKPKTAPKTDLGKAKAAPKAPGDDSTEPDNEAPAGAGVSVEIDRVMKAGALVSGTVRFSDGVSAAWSLDQFGRLGLNTTRKGYRPSAEDLQDFQQELARLLQSRGM